MVRQMMRCAGGIRHSTVEAGVGLAERSGFELAVPIQEEPTGAGRYENHHRELSSGSSETVLPVRIHYAPPRSRVCRVSLLKT
jgi:hypothetical protein